MRKGRFSFYGFLLLAWLVFHVPYINVPFKWYETFFHEISHGIAALMTGGRIISLELNFNGSGAVLYAGSKFPGIVAFSGYAGAFFWGAVIYLLASYTKKFSTVLAAVFSAAVVVSGILWVRDIESAIVAVSIFMILLALSRAGGITPSHYGLRFIGSYVIVSAMYSPVFLFFLHGRGSDAEKLRDYTAIPEFVWIFAWLSGGILTLWLIYKIVDSQPQGAELKSI
ncbi:MAG: M50 family metallopeptidase [Bacillota bacterium]